MKISPGWLKENIFKNEKCLAKNLNKQTKHPFSPSPSQGCAGGGVVWLFSATNHGLVMAMKQ
jgi:hypothetical protein